jgi:hypothetical protein
VQLSCCIALAGMTAAGVSGYTPKFFEDDPIGREPESQAATGVKNSAMSMFGGQTAGLLLQMRQPDSPPRAANVNTIDEVPDSNWFTNRVGTRPVSAADLQAGPSTGPGPAPGIWTIVRSKHEGGTPGFTVEDPTGVRWFLKFDARDCPEGPTGAEIVASKILWGLGYFTAQDYIAEMRRDQLRMGSHVTFDPPSGRRRRMTMTDVDRLLRGVAQKPNGAYRVFASRALEGKLVGPFRFVGTRVDDPNDVVPHENRRELRALRVFGAWINFIDLWAGNTEDSVVTEDGRTFVRHYLLDVGSTFGMGTVAPHRPEQGYAYLADLGSTGAPLVTLGFSIRPWLTTPYPRYPSVGLFEGDHFDPDTWKPDVPNHAYLCARADDKFWAARRVMAFTDDMVRAAVAAAQYSDPAAARYLADVLIERRDRIGRTYLPAINPLVDFSLGDDGLLTFANAAVDARAAAAPGGYRARWARFDNATGQTAPIGGETLSRDTRMQGPANLPHAIGDYVRVDVSATESRNESWTRPVQVYFRRVADGWRLVGLERQQ